MRASVKTHLSCYANRVTLVMPIVSRLTCYQAGASDFPHSRQEFLARDVINPQNGHILCDAKPGTLGVTAANSFETESLTKAIRLRTRSRNR
jgi:hypothetical protein